MNTHFIALLVACTFCLLSGCSERDEATTGNTHSAVTDTAITAVYPDLYQAVFSRDDIKLLQFVDKANPHVRGQAWRALAQTPIDSISSFIKKVKQADSEEAWFALSLHDLTAEQLRDLEQYWLRQPDERKDISLVLGRQGDDETLGFLMNHLSEITGNDYEAEAALAVSRLMIRNQVNEKQQLQMINAAFTGSDSQVIRPWLYGFYRGDDEAISEAVKDSLVERWKAFGTGKSVQVDQYIAGIIGVPVFADIMQHYSSSGGLDAQVQLGIELAQLVDEVEIGVKTISHIKQLLNHPNPHVVQQALVNLANNIEPDDSLFVFIQDRIMNDNEISLFVWVQATNTLATADPQLVRAHHDRLDSISENHPYLYPQVLDAWMKGESMNAFLNRLEQTIGQGDSLRSMHAVQALNAFRLQLEGVSAAEIKDRMREITFDALALKDRSVTFAAQPLLQDADLFSTDDFKRINQYLNNFSLPADIEVYQAFGSLYKERFEQQAKPVVDSLAALGYVPLNRSLQRTGWEVEVQDDLDTEFRTPDWDRLWELGEQPVWVLETEKGTIKVKMNTLSAPATIAAIDSLTRAGAYDGVPFHRVVPNFVIQGGDIERRDGFGGPDFTIPTEPSDQGFVRGAAGIASAGPDTEGSQYFFMHQWKPHLNGGYTLFGNVIEGMEVVDRIVVGDKVKQAYWE